MLLSVIDLFAGCGGISRGLATTGHFATDFAVEIEPHAAGAFRTNIKNRSGNPTDVFTGDIEALLADRRALRRHLDTAGVTEPGTLDVLVGGPPCQGFSRNGVRRYDDPSGTRFYDMPINHLYKSFLEFLEMLAPKVVLIENVREFLNADGGKFRDDLFSRLQELGYQASAATVCAADYGVAQMRHRMIVLAARSPYYVSMPERTHSAASDGQLGLWANGYNTVRDAISDLPQPTFVRSVERVQYVKYKELSELAKCLRSDSGGVPNHVARKLSPQQLARIRAVGTGRMRDVDEKLQTRKFYGSAYGRLAWDEPALTITTWVYHVGSGRFAHPEDDRAITMREAARLQSFDDDFVFPPFINPVSRMIGNAVPPLLAKAIGFKIATALAPKRSRHSPKTLQGHGTYHRERVISG